jgi:ABC-2 type transport system permease protein
VIPSSQAGCWGILPTGLRMHREEIGIRGYMNVFLNEVRGYRRSLLGWSIGLGAIMVIYAPYMSTFINDSASMRGFFSNLGQASLDALGINLDLIFGPLGFFNYILGFMTLAAGIQALSLGLRIIAEENRYKATDFLLTKPASRVSIYLQKLLAGAVCLLITDLVADVVSFVSLSAAAGSSLPVGTFVILVGTMTLVQMFLFALGLLIASVIPRLKQTIGTGIGLTLAFYLIAMVANLLGGDTLSWLTPFKYYEGNYVIVHDAYDAKYLLAGLALTVVFAVVGLMVYRRRDLAAS